jgi:hypothetical protein
MFQKILQGQITQMIQMVCYKINFAGYPRSEMTIRGSTKIQTLTEEEIEKMRVSCKVSFGNLHRLEEKF